MSKNKKNIPVKVEAEAEIAPIETMTNIAIFDGIFTDVSKFDFSAFKLRFIKFDSDEFRQLMITHGYFEGVINNRIEEIAKKFATPELLQVLIPINFEIEVSESTFYEIQSFLKIIYPSDASIVRLLKFQLFQTDKLHLIRETFFDFHSTGENYFDNYLKHDLVEVESVNKFIPLYFDRKDSIPYLKNMIIAYLTSYHQNFMHMKYLSLCIALESLISGDNDLTYRMRRSTAILLTNSEEVGWQIYNNVNEIYSLRSAIVHSKEMLDYGKLELYTPYLKNVISRLIIELVSFNITDNKELDKRITSLGFGARRKISKDYEEFKICRKVLENVLTTNLKVSYSELKSKLKAAKK